MRKKSVHFYLTTTILWYFKRESIIRFRNWLRITLISFLGKSGTISWTFGRNEFIVITVVFFVIVVSFSILNIQIVYSKVIISLKEEQIYRYEWILFLGNLGRRSRLNQTVKSFVLILVLNNAVVRRFSPNKEPMTLVYSLAPKFCLLSHRWPDFA